MIDDSAPVNNFTHRYLVKLHTVIVFPRSSKGDKFTAIMDRSPYGYGDLEWVRFLKHATISIFFYY